MQPGKRQPPVSQSQRAALKRGDRAAPATDCLGTAPAVDLLIASACGAALPKRRVLARLAFDDSKLPYQRILLRVHESDNVNESRINAVDDGVRKTLY